MHTSSHGGSVVGGSGEGIGVGEAETEGKIVLVVQFRKAIMKYTVVCEGLSKFSVSTQTMSGSILPPDELLPVERTLQLSGQ